MKPSSLTSTSCRRSIAAVLLTFGLTAASTLPAAAQTAVDDIAVGRDQLRTARTTFVAKAMQLTEEEGRVFWPVYREYRAAMDRVVDGLEKLVVAYAEVYPNVPPERADKMLKDYLALEKQFVETRTAYLEKFAKTLPATNVLLLAQLENRLDVAVRMQLADAIPLIPAPAAVKETGDRVH